MIASAFAKITRKGKDVIHPRPKLVPKFIATQLAAKLPHFGVASRITLQPKVPMADLSRGFVQWWLQKQFFVAG